MHMPSLASIFAVELETVLRAHGSAIENLTRHPFTLDRRKVDRLQQSLHDVSQLPALNHGELMTIVLMLKLTETEQRGIFAALVALGVQRMMLDYLSPGRAYAVAQEVRDAVMVRKQGDDAGSGFFRRRSMQRRVEDWTQGEQTLFDEAWNAYDEGIAFAALGIDQGGSMGQSAFARAVLALERAEALMRLLPDSVKGDDDWQYWYAEITRELAEARDALV
jgi:hypothetical protein